MQRDVPALRVSSSGGSVVRISARAFLDVVQHPGLLTTATLVLTTAQLMVRAPLRQLPHGLFDAIALQHALALLGLALICAAILVAAFVGPGLGILSDRDKVLALHVGLRHAIAQASAALVSGFGFALSLGLQLCAMVAYTQLAVLVDDPLRGAAAFALLFVPGSLCAALFLASGLLAGARVAHHPAPYAGPLIGLRALGRAIVLILSVPGRSLRLAVTLALANLPLLLLGASLTTHALRGPLDTASLFAHLLVGLCLSVGILATGLSIVRALDRSA